jgi:hypothetical protein
MDRIHALAAKPGGGEQIESEAKDMAVREAAALDRAAQSQAREVERVLGKAGDIPEAAHALAAVRDARAKLSGETSGVTGAGDAATALQHARAALSAYADVAAAYATAQAQYLPAGRKQFTAVAQRLRTTADSVVTMANGSKPGLFASAARKKAYQTLKDNADQAKARQAQIETLTTTVSTAVDAKRVDAAIKEATSLGQTLDALYASSSEAAQVK